MTAAKAIGFRFGASRADLVRPLVSGPIATAVCGPDVEPVSETVRILSGGRTLVETNAALRVVGVGPVPFYFLPAQHVDMSRLHPSDRQGRTDWGGRIAYFHLIGPDGLIPNAVWFYPEPVAGMEGIRMHLAVFPQAVDEIRVGRSVVQPYSDAPHGGWVLADPVVPLRSV